MDIHKILFASLALMAVSCTSRIDYRSGLEESLLVVNARLRMDESRHAVSVSLSSLRESACQDLTDAQVDVFINGKYHSSAEYYVLGKPDDDYSWYLYLSGAIERRPGYYFDAEFHEGDEIRLEVSRGDLHASATTIMPKAVGLMSIDTIMVKECPYFDNPDALKCSIKMRDVHGESNYMRLMAEYHVDLTRHHGPTPQYDTLEMWSTIKPTMYFDDDPVLRGTFHSSREQEAIRETDLNLPLVTNKYCIFPDTGFSDSDYTADIYLKETVFYNPEPGFPFPRTMNSSLSFNLITMNHDEYLYMLAYTNAETNGMLHSGEVITQMLFEPVTFPCNVEGGLGFVCAENVSSIRFDFPQKYIPAETTN